MYCELATALSISSGQFQVTSLSELVSSLKNGAWDNFCLLGSLWKVNKQDSKCITYYYYDDNVMY